MTFLPAVQTFNRLAAVDLRDMSEDLHSALRREAIRKGISISEYFGQIITEASTRLLGSSSADSVATSEGGEA